MNNISRLQKVFSNALMIDESQVVDGLQYQSIPEWDSISHMVLITEIEDEFGISFDTDDVIDLSSVAKAKEILNKYNIQF